LCRVKKGNELYSDDVEVVEIVGVASISVGYDALYKGI
jgi:hypothetical protein